MNRSMFLAGSAVLLTACGRRRENAQVNKRTFGVLDSQLQPLRSDFNRDRTKTRVVMLVSPTCPECLLGSSEIEQSLFEKTRDRNLAGFAVWVPKLGAQAGDVPNGMNLVTDKRIRHYWDQEERLGTFYESLLPTPGTQSWDVYLLYAPGITWTQAAPPEPTFWMHQLSDVTAAPHLDPAIFTAKARALLARN